MGVKKPEIIWTFFCKAGLTYAGDRSAVEFPLDVGSWRENVPGVLDGCISLLTIWDFPLLEYLPVPQRVGSYISLLPLKPIWHTCMRFGKWKWNGSFAHDASAMDFCKASHGQTGIYSKAPPAALCVLRGSLWIQQVWCGSGASTDLLVSLCFAEIMFCTNWRSVATMCWTRRLVPFSQQHLFTSCLCVRFW